MVFHDSQDWGRDIQILCDLLTSDSGYLWKGLRSPTASQQPPPTAGVPLYFASADFVYGSSFPKPRFAQGAFLHALASVYARLAPLHGLPPDLPPARTYGKPHRAAFEFADRALHRRRAALWPGGLAAAGAAAAGKGEEGRPPMAACYMVGDNPASDVAGANAYGWRSVLTRTGVYRGGPHEAGVVVDNVEDAVRRILKDFTEAASVHGMNPQFLVEKIIRSRIYESIYWKEHCFALTAESLVDKAVTLKYVGGQFGMQRPSEFLCLTLKLLQLQPDKSIIRLYLQNEEHKYLTALAAFYLRLTFSSIECYQYLEPLLLDKRKLRMRNLNGNYYLSYMDEFADSLLRSDRVCDIALPRITKRSVLVETGDLEDRISPLETDLLDLDDGPPLEEGEEREEQDMHVVPAGGPRQNSEQGEYEAKRAETEGTNGDAKSKVEPRFEPDGDRTSRRSNWDRTKGSEDDAERRPETGEARRQHADRSRSEWDKRPDGRGNDETEGRNRRRDRDERYHTRDRDRDRDRDWDGGHRSRREDDRRHDDRRRHDRDDESRRAHRGRDDDDHGRRRRSSHSRSPSRRRSRSRSADDAGRRHRDRRDRGAGDALRRRGSTSPERRASPPPPARRRDDSAASPPPAAASAADKHHRKWSSKRVSSLFKKPSAVPAAAAAEDAAGQGGGGAGGSGAANPAAGAKGGAGGAGDISLSVEETNKMRLALGLAPLKP
ncbi:hypothetical protein HK405_011738 [Cladochytrium tenue]|nr:hypothetical protein HK405_011738 [Cladochytrium tenue]